MTSQQPLAKRRGSGVAMKSSSPDDDVDGVVGAGGGAAAAVMAWGADAVAKALVDGFTGVGLCVVVLPVVVT